MRSSFLLLLISLCAGTGAVMLTSATCPAHSDLTSPTTKTMCDEAGGTWNSGSSNCSPPSGGSLKDVCICSSGYTCYNNDNCHATYADNTPYMFPQNGVPCYVNPCPNCNGQGTCSSAYFPTCTCTTDWTPRKPGSADVCTIAPKTNCPLAFTTTQKGYVVSGLTAGVAAGTSANTTCAAGYVGQDGSSISPASITCLAAGGVYSSTSDTTFSGCKANATCPPIVIANSAFALDGDLCSSTGVTYVDQECVFKCSNQMYPPPDNSGVFCRADGTYSGQPTSGCGVATSSSTGSGSGNGTISCLRPILKHRWNHRNHYRSHRHDHGCGSCMVLTTLPHPFSCPLRVSCLIKPS